MSESVVEQPGTILPEANETSAIPSGAEENALFWEKACSELEKKYAVLQQRSIVEKVCYETGCSDPEYLEFSASRQGVNLNDPDELRHFAREFSLRSPGCFHARITPGSSAGNGVKNDSPVDGTGENFTQDRIGFIALSIDSAPDVVNR